MGDIPSNTPTGNPTAVDVVNANEFFSCHEVIRKKQTLRRFCQTTDEHHGFKMKNFDQVQIYSRSSAEAKGNDKICAN